MSIELCTCCDACGLVYNAVEPGEPCRVCGGTIKIDILESLEQREIRQRSQEETLNLLVASTTGR